MKLETNFELWPVVAWICGMIIITSIVEAILTYQRTALEQGYIEQQVEGSTATMWVKP